MVENCRLTSGSLSSERRSSNLRDTTNLTLARPEEKICLPLPPPGPSPYRGPGARHVLKHEVSYFNKNKGKNLPSTLSGREGGTLKPEHCNENIDQPRFNLRYEGPKTRLVLFQCAPQLSQQFKSNRGKL